MKERSAPVHGLLTANKLVYNEAVDIFHEDTRFKVRCYANAYNFMPQAPGLGKVSDCQLFSHIRHLELNVYINKPDGLRDFINRLRPLLDALDDGRRLFCLDLAFMHNCSDEEHPSMYLKMAPTFDKLKSVISVFQRLGCSGNVNVRWSDPPSMDVGELSEESQRAMKLVVKLRGQIIENGKAFPKRDGACDHREKELMRIYGSVHAFDDEEAFSDEGSVDHDDDLGDVEWVSEDDEWFSEDEHRFSDIF
ncbi:hypothetical protein LTR65_001303 [Meristemomyces frigidus]